MYVRSHILVNMDKVIIELFLSDGNILLVANVSYDIEKFITTATSVYCTGFLLVVKLVDAKRIQRLVIISNFRRDLYKKKSNNTNLA